MNTLSKIPYICGFIAAISLASEATASTVVFADDFSSSAILKQGNPYVGGWFTPQLAFAQWTGTSEASISSGSLNVNSTSSTRSAGIILPPGFFSGAGDYILSFDLKSYTGDANDSAVATVWSGSGYDLTRSTGNAITVDTYSAGLQKNGSAQVMKLAGMTLTAAANNNQVGFTYDGTSAVALFLGVKTEGWPFPSASYDNVSISKVAINVVPEPTVPLLLGVAAGSFAFFRRRNA